MKKFKIETPDFILFMDADSVLDAIIKISAKYGFSFSNSIISIKSI